jgi:hypothetical protein
MLATQNRYGLNWDATLPVYVGKRTPRPTTKIELGKRINQIEFDYKNLVAQNLPIPSSIKTQYNLKSWWVVSHW